MPTFKKTATTVIDDFAAPELFFLYKGVKISHTYIEDDTDYGFHFIGSNRETTVRETSTFSTTRVSKRLFSTNARCGFVPRFDENFEYELNRWMKQPKDETRGVFNIQNIPNPNGHHITTFAGIQRVLIEAIDSGWIKANKTPECIHDCHILAHPA